MKWRLETVGRSFLSGYHAALEEAALEASALERLDERLTGLRPSLRGFAYEGAAMGLTIVDALRRPRGRAKRLASFIEGPGAPYTYLAHVGSGWALARLPRLLHRGAFAAYDPLLGWLAFDGWGFHQAYFEPEATVRRGERPSQFSAGASGRYSSRAFDQGVGRALWFVELMRVDAVADRIDSLGAARAADLWSGVGLACAYAGGAGDDDLRRLVDRCGTSAHGDHRAAMAQGTAFAAKARLAADGSTRWLESACRIVCGLDATAAADATDEALIDLAIEPTFDPRLETPAFEHWRARIQERLAPVAGTPSHARFADSVDPGRFPRLERKTA